MLVLLALTLASAFAGPDPQSVLSQAALAWEARKVPDAVDWSIDAAAARGPAVRRSCTVRPQAAPSADCFAPGGTRLFFDDTNDPFREPPQTYAVSFGAPGTLNGRPAYHLVLAPRTPERALAPLTEVWAGTDDYEVLQLTYAGTTYAFSQYGPDRTWWTQRAWGQWGSVQSASVAFSGPKTIASLRVTPLCFAVRTMVVPFLAIERNNRSLFGEMDSNVKRFYEAAMVADDPGSPGMILARGNLDWYAAQMYVNLANADLLLKASYERMPVGKDPPLDALRARIQTLVDVERIATNQYASLAAPRPTGYRYWNSMTAEVAQLKALDGGSAIADPPPPQGYGTNWLFSQLTTERRDITRPAMMAADYCGVHAP